MSERPFDVRRVRAKDFAFVRDAWIESLVMHARDLIKREVDKLIRSSRIVVACDREDDDTILGFAAIEDSALHYAYVKAPLRNEGVARALLEPEALSTHTFCTALGEQALKPKERGWEHRPRIVL